MTTNEVINKRNKALEEEVIVHMKLDISPSHTWVIF